MVSNDLIKRMAEAVAAAEGFYAHVAPGEEPPIPVRANNPCDLMDDGNLGWGTLGEGITVYPAVEKGWEAAYHKFERMLNGHSSVYPLTLSIAQVGMKYSGHDPNWGINVSRKLGVQPETTLEELVAMDGDWSAI